MQVNATNKKDNAFALLNYREQESWEREQRTAAIRDD